MIEPSVANGFLAQRRIAVVGASPDPKNFGTTVYRALRDRGYDVVPVNPNAAVVDGAWCYPSVVDVPGDLDGVIVMVGQEKALDVVASCAERGVPRVWLFKGLGSPGAVSDAAVELCEGHGIQVVAGACPFMFLAPVKGFHRVHRAMRRMNGSLAKAS